MSIMKKVVNEMLRTIWILREFLKPILEPVNMPFPLVVITTFQKKKIYFGV
jgi:hypothetical protein